RFYDGRRGTVSAGRAVKVGIFAFIVASLLDCNVPLMGFSVLTASLLVQMLAKSWPLPALEANISAQSRATAHPEGAGQPHAAAVAVSRSVDTATGEASLPAQRGRTELQTETSSVLERSAAARSLWLVLAALFIGCAVLS